MSLQLISIRLCCVLLALLFSSQPALADKLDDLRELWLSGEYQRCAELSAHSLKQPRLGLERYAEWNARAEAAQGNYEQACLVLVENLRFAPRDIQNRWLLIQLAPFAGKPEIAANQLKEIETLVRNAAWRYTQDSANLVTLAHFALAQGADARQVQKVMLERARKLEPTRLEAILASGQLALDKHDYALAAEDFRKGLKLSPEHPELLFGLAQALDSSNPSKAKELLTQTLKKNPHHAGAILVQSEKLIDAEQFEQAFSRLNDILATNPVDPEALALQSVTRELQGQHEKADALRSRALSSWASNPRVDFLIGKKLSQKYRFQEGATAQRRALQFDPEYLPAKKQLAVDLLRLGKEDEGWKLADAVYQKDQYDIASYNLMTLRDEIEKFTTIQRDGLHLRMEQREAEIYGARAAELLAEAKQVLCEKYQLKLPETVLIEIFPKPADFAVRTFGLPGAGGYLGVCFGNVITANSPASQTTHPVNWESVLWHEFAHVVTLNKTHNRMPRWLSEGISVYEERLRDPKCGEQMTPVYRKMINEGQLTPISQLSSAFLSPRSPQHLMFAYFESSMVVQYISETYGHSALLAILDDLAVGMGINEAIERHTIPLPQLENDFEADLKIRAFLFGWTVDWSPPDFGRILELEDPSSELVEWAADHPRNYLGLKSCGELLVQLNHPEAALQVFEKAILAFPYETGSESVLAQLAAIQQQLGHAKAEQAAWEALVRIDDAATTALLRLIEIETAEADWSAVEDYSRELLAINPLIPQPFEGLAAAAEHQGRHAEAIAALKTLLTLDPVDPADLHYRLASQLHETGESGSAKRHLLQALEKAPRYRDALALLLKLHEEASPDQ